MNKKSQRWAIPAIAGAIGIAAIVFWLTAPPKREFAARLPGQDRQPDQTSQAVTNAVLLGSLTRSNGAPAQIEGSWSQFRGPDRSGIASPSSSLAQSWPAGGPAQRWSIPAGEGYAGAAIWEGKVYLMDYDRENQQDALRCLSFSDGREIWRYAYPVSIKRNHGMTRTVPTVSDGLVAAIGPKCHVLVADAETGSLAWGFDMVHEFGATIPPWYTGQCPLVDGDRLILAPGGDSALLTAVNLRTGEIIWRTPNPRGWRMTHSSIMPMEVNGRRSYVYCGSGGVAGVSADDGAILWETDEWKIGIATVPSPLPLPDGKVFFCGGYNSGSAMLQIREENGKLVPTTLFKLDPEVFGATQHTPVFYEEHLFGIRPDGQFTCLNLDGGVAWTSGPDHLFGLGSFLVTPGGILALNDSGKLSLIAASVQGFELIAESQVLHGRESWGPMALADGRLIARDLTELICLDVASN